MEFAARDLHLRHTFDCGQAFRWQRSADISYEGVIDHYLVRVSQINDRVIITGAPPSVLERYFQPQDDLEAIVRTFPDDVHMRQASRFCGGLRLLRQDPWESLASFICSATKQIVQIRQMIANLSRSFGDPIPAVGGEQFAFPSVAAVARASHDQLRACKLGFRAKNLLATAQLIDSGQVRLDRIEAMDYPRAVEELTRLPGVGPKIADCALLFGWGRQEAVPLDVWIERALRTLYFPRQPHATRRQLIEFKEHYFGPYAGYAQQYLFHYVRHNPQALTPNRGRRPQSGRDRPAPAS